MERAEFKKFDFAKPDVLLFSFQVILIFIVVCVCLMNLTLQWGNLNMWTVILTGSLGYIMPNPKLSADIGKLENGKKGQQDENIELH